MHYHASGSKKLRRLVLRSALFVVLILLVAGAAARATGSFSSSPTPPRGGVGYWHTSGTWIEDARNNRVRIAGVTWYGMDTSHWVPAGLDYQPYTTIMREVKSLGFNVIRLPFSNELVENDPVIIDRVKANPELLGMRALTLLDRIVNFARHIGLKIVLDDNRSTAARPNQVNYLLEPLWYTNDYPESAWISDWLTLARRYKGNSAVIGFDLRNEPHSNGPSGPWTLQTYLHGGGATWGPYNGVDDPSTDWRLAAERAGDAILRVNPKLLIFVEGIQIVPDPSQPGGISQYFWSGDLRPVKQYPVSLNIPDHLVYEAHDYGPWKWDFPWFHNMSYPEMSNVWNQHWAFLANTPNASYTAPVWLGEFGTCTNNPQCVDDQRPDNQATWFHLLLQFLQNHPQIGWSFFALNGTNANNGVTDNGIMNGKWNGVSNPALQQDLQSIQ